MPESLLTHYACPACGEEHEPESGVLRCPCGSPIMARYADEAVPPATEFLARRKGLWRWAELLPVRATACRVSLGEGDTPLLHVPALGDALGLHNLWVKDEGRNPTSTFKSRGVAVAVSLAKEAGCELVAVPTAGNAGGASAAYAAAAGLKCLVTAPEGTPEPALAEARQHGAEVRVVGSHIGEAAAALMAHPPEGEWRNLSTFGEPGRVEGKKTITLEICEQVPDGEIDAMIFPTGGGTGLVAARKAIADVEELGRRSLAGRPKLIAAQAAGCAPIVKAWESGADRHQPWTDPAGPAGLRVPNPLAGPLILQAIRETGGAAMAATPGEIAEAQRRAFELSGIAPCLESAAAFAIIPKLLQRAVIEPGDKVVVISTGDACKDPS